MTDITPFYEHGSRIIEPDDVIPRIEQIIDHLGGVDAACLGLFADQFFPFEGYGEWYLEIFQISNGRLESDLMAESNEATLREEYADASILRVDESAHVTRLLLPLDDETWARLFPAEDASDVDHELAEEYLDEISGALNRAEGAANYPLLDESDYSERVTKAWNKALDEELNHAGVSDDDRQRVAEYVSERWDGYAEPGWVDPDWVREAIAELDVTVED